VRVLITCCGRSGSVFTSKLLQRLKIPVGHEVSAEGGCVGYNWPIWLHEKYDAILHQIREPLACIRSLTTIRTAIFKMVARNAGEVDRPKGITDDEWLIVRAMNYYVRWNQKSREAATWSYRVECLKRNDPVYLEWGRRLDLPEDVLKAVHGLSRNTNTRKDKPDQYTYPEVNWEILQGLHPQLFEEVAIMAQEHGYETNEVTHVG